MAKVIEAIFENGVIRPLQAVELEEHQRVRVVITPLPGVVAETQGMVAAPAELVQEVADHDDFLPF